jgi:hypothetical protein
MSAVAPRITAVAVATVVVLSGCVQTTIGKPVKAPGSGPLGPNAPALSESSLDQIMLPVGDVSSIVGGTGLQITSSSQDLADSSDIVNKMDCLGAVFAAEKKVYEDSSWKAARDQIIREPGDDKKHWVEQTVVLFPSGQQAADFFRNSRDEWKTCANSSVTTRGDDSSYDWRFGQVAEPSETMFSVGMAQQNSDGRACQHAMGAVSNIIIEGVACGHGVGSEGQQIVQGIVQNATSQ